MEIGLFILMLLMYLVPEILKRRKKKEPYKYPDAPWTGTTEGQNQNSGIPGTLAKGMKPPPVPLQITEGAAGDEGLAGDEGVQDWGIQPMTEVPALADARIGGAALDPAMAGQAIVWAEVIAPPVSMRLARGQRRRF
jgi:hypothetical protein